MTRLSRADLEAALAFAGELGAAAPTTPVRTPGCWIGSQRSSASTSRATTRLDAAHHAINEAEYGGTDPEALEAELPVSPNDLPFCVYARQIGDPYFPARRLSDILDIAAFRETELFEVLGADPSIQMRMPAAQDALGPRPWGGRDEISPTGTCCCSTR